MKRISFGDSSVKAEIGDVVSLQKLKDLEVVTCEKTDVLMLNIDASQIMPGDLTFIKKLGLTISNPDTEKLVALGVDYLDESWGHKINDFLSSSSDEDEDDESLFFEDEVFLGGFGNEGFGGSFDGGFSEFDGNPSNNNDSE